MRHTKYPTFINLKELEDQGEEFNFSRESAELNKALFDLIGDHAYICEIAMRPMGNAFEITGKIDTQITLPCARCGRDMEQKYKR